MRTPRTKIRRKEDKKEILRLTETPPKSSDSCTQEDNENNNNNQQNLRILLLHFTNYNSESNPFAQTYKSKRRQNKPHQSLQILARKDATTTTTIKNCRFFFYT
jgi:hypothetical protein